jgi:CRISPR-associated protein Csd1
MRLRAQFFAQESRIGPNASRLSVRFWHTSTLGDLATNLQEHHRDLAIVRQWDETNSKKPDPKVPGGISRLLRQTLLAGALIRSILLGTNYPDALFQKVMSRLRVAEKENGNALDRVSYLRAAIIKAYLNRNHKLHLPMSLDTSRTDPAYLLGRLFAVLEKTQQDALPEINATIRDRFYSAASATPGAVFPRILRNYQHHLSKLEGGFRVNRERLVQDIVDAVRDFPAHLHLRQQGQFAIGYYHQRKDLFSKKTATTTE